MTELMVTVAVIAILLTIATPSFKEMIAQQRLKNINAELVTTLQFARTEAIARNTPVFLKFGSSTSPRMTCYMLYTSPSAGCDCKNPPGQACENIPDAEVRTIQIPASTDVKVTGTVGGAANSYYFTAEGVLSVPAGLILAKVKRISDAAGCLQTSVNGIGRPSACSPDQSVSGVPMCSPASIC